MEKTVNLLTTKDIALRLTISEDEACRLVREGHIPHVDIPGRKHWRVRPEDLQAFIDAKLVSRDERYSRQVTPIKGRPDGHLIAMPALSDWMQKYK